MKYAISYQHQKKTRKISLKHQSEQYQKKMIIMDYLSQINLNKRAKIFLPEERTLLQPSGK